MGLIKLNGKTYSGHPVTASDITFNNSTSGLKSTTVQNAITFLDELVDSNVSKISTLTTNTNNLKTKLHPVGSTYITSTNSNPSSYLGGTWTLIDKKFKNSYHNSETSGTLFTMNTTNCSAFNFRAIRGDDIIRFFLSVTTKVELTDTRVYFGTIDFAAVGLTGFPFDCVLTGWSDGGNADVLCTIEQDSGKFSCVDIVGPSSMVADKTIYLTCTLPLSMEYMLDSFCDKFYWKRTA